MKSTQQEKSYMVLEKEKYKIYMFDIFLIVISFFIITFLKYEIFFLSLFFEVNFLF
jgi:uncharacterized membrane protein YukC